MKVQKLSSVDGFVVWDVPDAPVSVGPTRLGAKLIAGNATMYARSLTYAFAALEQQRAGMTIGLRVDPAGTEPAVAALAGELEGPLLEQRLYTWADLRLSDEDLAPVTGHDQRPALHRDQQDGIRVEDRAAAVGAATVADRLLGGLDGRAVAIEGFDGPSVALVREVEARGGRVARIARGTGMTEQDGMTADRLAATWAEHGDGMVDALGGGGPGWKVWTGDGVDLVFAGSAPGALTGQGAELLGGTPVVPVGPAPVSAKAFAVMRAQGAVLAPDWSGAVGRILSWWPEEAETADQLAGRVAEVAASLFDEVAHDDGLFLGSCYRAETYLRTWTEELPFGRPLG